MSLSTTQYGYIIDPMVPFTDDKGKTIKNGFIRVFMAGTSTPVLTYRNYDGATNQEKIELDNSGRVKHNVIGSKGSLYKVVVYNILHSQENPLLTVDKIAVLGASINATGATIVTGIDSVTVQEENFIKATVEGTSVELSLDPTEVTSELSTIGAAETAAPDYVVPLLEKTGTEDSKKISLANLFKFALDWISRLATTITSFASGDFIAVSNPTDGTRKMSKDTLLQLTSQNALAGNLAPGFDPTKPNDDGGYAYYSGENVTYYGKNFVFVVNHKSGDWNASEVEQKPLSEAISLEGVGQAVQDWLDSHPEATTTVLDGSLTYKKLVTGTLNFVTPEMYGASGDGVSDDWDAFNLMLSDGNKFCLLSPNKIYYVSKTLYYNSNTIIEFNNSTIKSGVNGHVFSCIGSSDSRKSNIVFRNGVIFGAGENGNVGDQGAGILGWRVDNIVVENVKFSNTYGDGILFRDCENVIIYNCEITKYGRNGISPISGSFYIDKLKVYGRALSGANPGLCFDCEPEANEKTKLHVVNCSLTDAYFVDFYTENDNDDFCIELLMENTKVWSLYNGVNFVSSHNLNARNVKLVNCDFKITLYESSCIKIDKTSGIVVDSCKFSHEIVSPVNTHCISITGDLRNLVLKDVDFSNFPNALFAYNGSLENLIADGVTTSIYTHFLRNSKISNSKITDFLLRDGHTIDESTGNTAFNSILPDKLRKVCLLGGHIGQFLCSSVLSDEYILDDRDYTDAGETKIISIPLPAKDASKGHCYLISIGYCHRGSTSNTAHKVISLYCGDLGSTITEIVSVGDKSITMSYNNSQHCLIVTLQKNFYGTLSWVILG